MNSKINYNIQYFTDNNSINTINITWDNLCNVKNFDEKYQIISSDNRIKSIIDEVLYGLDKGHIQIAQEIDNFWHVHEWIKKVILMHFIYSKNKLYELNDFKFLDKCRLKYSNYNKEDFERDKVRVLPGAIVRYGSYIGPNNVIMPSFVNIGAYVGQNSLIDSWATVGSCAYIGNNCHISGGAGIGGVLEPLQALPVIIENNCFIGARSEIVEGVRVCEGSVISMGVFIGQSTKIVRRDTGEISYGVVPPYSVVVPGSIQSGDFGVNTYCAVIVKQVDKQTRSKVSINELLRM